VHVSKTSRRSLLLLCTSALSACALVVGIEDHHLAPGAAVDGGLASDAMVVAPSSDAGGPTPNHLGKGPIECVASSVTLTCTAGHTCCAIFGPEDDRCVDADVSSCSTNYPSAILACDDSADCAPNVCCSFARSDGFEAYCVSPDECLPPHHRMCTHGYDCDGGSDCKQIVLDGGLSAYRACQ
jgi:hypothetical protein